MTKQLEQIVIDQIRAYEMISEGDRVIAGVSGGMDSVCLLHILNKLSGEWNFRVFAVHVNHMLRGDEAERDKKFVKDLCASLSIPCMTVNADVEKIAASRGMGIEEAGRFARYKAFEAAASKIAGEDEYAGIKVALAHHRDDNVETVLLNLARGSGINGLRGIVPVNKRGALTIIRPMLGAGKEDIKAYIDDNSLSFVSDSTNTNDDFARNRIRLNIVPELVKINSRACVHISETASFMNQIQAYMEKQIEAAAGTVADFRDDSIAISCDKLRDCDPAVQTGVIYYCIGKMAGTMKDITHVHVRDCLSLADKQTGRRIELPYGLRACKSYGNILIRRNNPAPGIVRMDYEEKPVHMTLDSHLNISVSDIERGGGKTFITADGGTISFVVTEVTDENRQKLVEKNIYKKAFDCDTIKGSLIFGRPMSDDQIRFSGGSKSLKKYFTDEKIPWEIRNRLMVLKDLNGTLWVIGYRIGEPYKITDKTTKALIVTITGGDNEQHRSSD